MLKLSTRKLIKTLKITRNNELLRPVCNPGTHSLQDRRASLAKHRQAQLRQSREASGSSAALRRLIKRFHTYKTCSPNGYFP